MEVPRHGNSFRARAQRPERARQTESPFAALPFVLHSYMQLPELGIATTAGAHLRKSAATFPPRLYAMGAVCCLVNYDGREADEGICEHLLSSSIGNELARYAEQRQTAMEHRSRFTAALKKSRRAGPYSFAHLIDSEVKLEKLDLIESESDADEDGVYVQVLNDDDNDSLSFKEQLDRELEKPFDPGLLAKLLGLASERKPVVRHRESRQRTMDVETTQEGLSYLDHHPDFATSLASSSTPQDQLGLLRGFFFWLQRACDPTAFKPWASPSSSQAFKAGAATSASSSQNSDGFDCQIVDKPTEWLLKLMNC